MGEQFCLRWNNHQSTVVSVVESFLNSDSLTDCTLAAEGKYLKAHKLILTACSPYFEALLCQQHHDKHPIFILKDVKFYELKAMLDYMYKGEVNISQDRLDSFIKTAESLQIKGLTDQGGGGGDCRDVGSTGKRKPGGGRPESPQAGAAPAREGSPLSKRRRRGPHCGGGGHSSLEEAPSTPAGPDAARLAVVPKSEPPDPSSSSSPPPPPLPPQQQQQPLALPLLPPAPPQQHPPPVKSELLLEDDETHHHIEDLTLDDDDDEDYGGGGGPPPDTSQPGTSFEGNSQASQDYSQWQMTGDRSTDEVFMAAQEAINSQSNSQGFFVGGECERVGSVSNLPRGLSVIFEPFTWTMSGVERDDSGEPLLWGEANPSEKSTEIVKQINSKNAKLVACALVFGFILYHGMVHVRFGTDSCKWLLSDGKYKGDKEWQPYGCMMHHYTQLDTRRCIRYLAFWGRQNRFVFIGDPRILDIYSGFVEELGGSPPPKGYRNHSYTDSQLRLTVEFIWSPYVSHLMLHSFNKWQGEREPPGLIVAGSETWPIRRSNGSAQGLREYSFNLSRLVRPIDTLAVKKSRVLWVLQEPVDEEKLPKQWTSLTNHLIDQYNWAAREVMSGSGGEVWGSSEGLARGGEGGLRIAAAPLRLHAQILLNLHCNDHMAFHDGTCCSSPEHRTTLQTLTYAVLAFCCVLGALLAVHRYRRRMNGEPPTPGYTLVLSLAKMGLIMAYFYLCDRTNFFMKENKYYSPVSFWLPLGYMFALGLFFTEDSRFTKVLHRDQTEETKGWMQLVVMIYQMTGASSNLHIRNHVQIVLSAYLFLSGYGHFYYLWHRADAGIVRFFQIIFRLNFLPVLLCLCMNRPYQFYSFAPLVSFWFLLVYLVLVAPPRVSAASVEANPLHYLYLVLKFVGLFTTIIVLYMSEVFFEKVFVTRPWKALFVTTDDDIHDWWMRWKLNRYSMCYGGVLGAAVVCGQRVGVLEDGGQGNLFSPRPALAASFLALLGLAAASAYALLCPNTLECEEVHSYTAFVPILSWIVLRNVSGVLRTRYSTLFSWLGKLSLELCFCQYHIWLAADSHGVLVFVPGYPVLNVLITSFIFVCVAHEIHQITGAVMPYAVPSDWRLVLRNFAVFLVVLVPIGIHDGMF